MADFYYDIPNIGTVSQSDYVIAHGMHIAHQNPNDRWAMYIGSNASNVDVGFYYRSGYIYPVFMSPNSGVEGYLANQDTNRVCLINNEYEDLYYGVTGGWLRGYAGNPFNIDTIYSSAEEVLENYRPPVPVPFKSFITPWGTLKIYNCPCDIEAIPYYYNTGTIYWPNVAIISQFSIESLRFTWLAGTETNQTESPISVTSHDETYDLYYGSIDINGYFDTNTEQLPVSMTSAAEILPYYTGGDCEEPCEDVEMLPHSPCKKHDIYVPPCNIKCPPVRIEITVLPDKLNYQSGEDIDLTGIVVRAFKANGNLWGGFPHGIIPIDELDYEPKIYTTSGDIYEKDGVRALALPCDVYSNHDSYCEGWHYAHPVNNGDGTTYKDYMARTTEGIIFYALYNGSVYGTTLDDVDSKRYLSSDPNGMTGFGTNPSYAAKTNFNPIIRGSQSTFENIISMIPDNTIAPYSVDFQGATREPSDTTVTVSWNYNGETFTDTYEIGG